MLIGAAGSGKTLIINEKLGQMDEDFLIANVPFNFYYNSELTQKILEKPLEKKEEYIFFTPIYLWLQSPLMMISQCLYFFLIWFLSASNINCQF